MADPPHDLARRLADRAEAVCRHYLSNGRRQGNYWTVGDVRNTPGRSMFVRLKDTAKGSAGRWTDAATGEHGDLLDVVREALGLIAFRDVAKEARAFLGVSHESALTPTLAHQSTHAPAGSTEAGRRLFAMSQPINGTVVETYLRGRGITTLHGTGALRFHPRCYYRPDDDRPTETWPAMIAAVTDHDGRLTGVHRTWLAPDGTARVRGTRRSRRLPRHLRHREADHSVRNLASDLCSGGGHRRRHHGAHAPDYDGPARTRRAGYRAGVLTPKHRPSRPRGRTPHVPFLLVAGKKTAARNSDLERALKSGCPALCPAPRQSRSQYWAETNDRGVDLFPWVTEREPVAFLG